MKVELKNLSREISSHKKMSHPNIIKFYDHLQIDHKIYMLLEYAPNGNLFSYISKKGKLSDSQALSIFGQCCDALNYIHEQGVIHRDIKVLFLGKNERKELKNIGGKARMALIFVFVWL